MSDVVEHRLRIDGRAARVWRGGAGAPLVLLHGGLGAAAPYWSPIWDRLAERYTVVAPDLPGFGASDELPEISLAAYSAWLDALFEELEVARPILVGHAFGAWLARLYAAGRPQQVTHVVLVGGGMVPRINLIVRALLARGWLSRWLIEHSSRRAFSASGLQRVVTRPENLPPSLVDGALASGRAFTEAMVRLAPQAPPDAQNPRAQTLVLWGGADRLNRPGRGMRVAGEIPDAQFWVMPEAGHLAQLDEPEAFLEAVRQFVESG